MKTLFSLMVLATTALVSSSAEACRCAIPSTPDLVSQSDAIVAGTVLWSHSEGMNNYTAVRFDRVARVSDRVSEATKESLSAQVAEGQIGFFRGRLSDGRTSCPGTDVSLPVNSRLVYVTTLGDYGRISLEGESIGHCSSFSTYIPAASQRYAELVKIFGDLR